MDEFELIRRYFAGLTAAHDGVVLGIGDDCALLQVPAGQELAVTTDTLVAGRHFPMDAAAYDIGWKSLAVNLSDLAAMAAEARWFTLALTLPDARPDWLAGFAAGLKDLADRSAVALVGGDTTAGPLSITITAMGWVPPGLALRRAGARVGDLVCVTGTLGDAALALQRRDASDLPDTLRARLDRPLPRLRAGVALRGLAHAGIDLSDGLAGDLGHILAASGVGAEIEATRLPMSAEFEWLTADAARLPLQARGGDDYELCICLPPSHLERARSAVDVPLTVIGRIIETPGLRFVDADGATIPLDPHGYRHFQ